MEWQEIQPEKPKYNGVNVLLKQVTISMWLSKELKLRKWERVTVSYDKDRTAIRFVPTTEPSGHTVLWQRINVALGTLLPLGRYNIERMAETEIILTKIA